MNILINNGAKIYGKIKQYVTKDGDEKTMQIISDALINQVKFWILE